MRLFKRHRKAEEQEQRLRDARAASERVASAREQVDEQISLVGKLTEGWREVHERNHLAELFDQEWRSVR